MVISKGVRVQLTSVKGSQDNALVTSFSRRIQSVAIMPSRVRVLKELETKVDELKGRLNFIAQVLVELCKARPQESGQSARGESDKKTNLTKPLTGEA